jgi:putative oxidoreductase
MERILGRFAPQCYALMRIVVGLLFACHGAQKLFGVLGGHQVPYVSQFGLAGVVELVGGLMIAVGFLTGFAAFVASGEMAFAYFTMHAPHGPWPIQNGGELPVLYCFVFLYMASRGAGIWGIGKGGSRR